MKRKINDFLNKFKDKDGDVPWGHIFAVGVIYLFSLLRLRVPHLGRITSVTVVDLLFGLSIVICVILVAMSDL